MSKVESWMAEVDETAEECVSEQDGILKGEEFGRELAKRIATVDCERKEAGSTRSLECEIALRSRVDCAPIFQAQLAPESMRAPASPWNS